ncbi:hypothetical protein [Amycolatopsis plumensis]|uniref:Uncharacterized protein n=1 Tax=Amycolatopsis plumensis TaxID=236508 RepID=A0ABV5TUI1_9PSEU
MIDDFTGYFEMESDVTISGELIGRVTYSTEWTITGNNFRSKPVAFNATFDTQDVVLEGLLFDSCGGQEGSSIDSTHGIYTVGSLPANTPAFWDPNGYNSYWQGGACKSQANQFSFVIPEYPDTTVWLIERSPAAYSPDPATDPLYRFRTALPADLPSTPLRGD